jgi:putative hemolysin
MKNMIFVLFFVTVALMFGCVDMNSDEKGATQEDERIASGSIENIETGEGDENTNNIRERILDEEEKDVEENLDEKTDVQEQDEESEQGQTVGMANPASVYCEERGGSLKLEGSVGMCELPDGEFCEEWAYFRGECPDWNKDDMSAKCKPLHIPEPDWSDTVNSYAARYGYGYDHAAFMLEKEYLMTQKKSVHEEYCNTAQYRIEKDVSGCDVCLKR